MKESGKLLSGVNIMKKSTIYGIVITLLICVAIPAAVILNMLNEARNYESVLKPKSNTINTGRTFNNGSITPLLHQNDMQAVSGATIDSPQGSEAAQTDTGSEKAAEDYTLKESYINILFLGIDKIDETDPANRIYRSDTIAIVRVNLDTMNVDILSIPRDSYVYIPLIQKKDKITHAYAFGSLKGDGVKSSIDTVNEFIKYSRIDYFFTVNLAPLPDIVDDLGGIELDVEIDMKTHGADLSKGYQLLDGRKAYDYIHWRYSADGDIGRIKRQQKFFKAMYGKLRDAKQLTKAVKLVLSYEKNIKTDMSLQQMLSLAMFANDMPEGSTTFHTIGGSAKFMNNRWYWIPDAEKTDELLKKLFAAE